MKKVLELFGEPFYRGGQEAFVMNVINSIDYTDLQIDICTPYDFNSDNYKKCIESKNGKIFAFNMPFNPGGLRLNLLNPVLELLKKSNYDVVHIHSGSIMALAVLSLAAKLAKVPKILVHSHATGDKENLKHFISKAICTPILCFCATDYLACSKSAAEWKFSKKIVKNKVQIIKNGIDLSKFKLDDEARTTYRANLGYTDNERVIGHVGRFSQEKNHHFIIDLFSELVKQSNDYRLLLLGDGELKNKIEDYARKKNVYDLITFTGNVSNVRDYLQAMDLFILPSEYEGLGIVGIEAQATGLPCIFSTGVPEEAKITDNVTFLPLDNIEIWKSTAYKEILLPKEKNTKKVQEAGYDITQTANRIYKIYLG